MDELGKSEPLHRRNEDLYNIFRYTTLIGDAGSGIARMKKAMEDEGLRDVEFHNFAGHFKVTFWGRNGLKELPKELTQDDNVIDLRELELKNRQIEALKLIINENKVINGDYYSKKYHVSKSTASRDLNDMANKKLITKKRSKKEVFFAKNPWEN